MSSVEGSAAAVARLTGALERQAEELRSVRSDLGLSSREGSRLLRPDEVALRLAKSRAWVYRNQHVLGGFRVGGQVRFEAEAIDNYLERCRQQTSTARTQKALGSDRVLAVGRARSAAGGGRETPPSA